MENEGRERNKARQLRIEPEQFQQAAIVARLAIELARFKKSDEPIELLNDAWKLTEAALEIVAPALSEQEQAYEKLLTSGGDSRHLAEWVKAHEEEQRISYADLIGKPTENGQETIEIINPGWKEGALQKGKWRKLTIGGFRDTLAKFVRSKCKEGTPEAWEKRILDEFEREKSLPLMTVWQIAESRWESASKRSQKAVKTKEKKAKAKTKLGRKRSK